MPLYVLQNSRPSPDKGDAKGNDSSKSKAGAPQYSEETVRSVEEILSTSDLCYADLTKLDEALQTEIAAQTSGGTQLTSDVSTLSTNLLSAQNSGDTLVASDLNRLIAEKKESLRVAQTKVKQFSQAESYVASLMNQASTYRNLALTQANSAPPTPPAASSTAMDVFQTIEQNLIKFLLFSLILGQILDPIQRGLMSFFGPRRNIFEVFNSVYGQKGDGEFRYGDRRLPPWTLPGTFLRRFAPPDSPADVQRITQTVSEEGLRYGPADYAYLRNANIYDPNYAMGAGYISQSEFNGIFNEYYSQSQITSGLILPLVILSICIGIRIVCCGTLVPTGSSAWLLFGPLLGAMYFAFLFGLFFTFVSSYFGSREYGKIFKTFIEDVLFGRRRIVDGVRFLIIVTLAVIVFVFLAIWMYEDSNILGWDVLPLVGLPCLFLCPLWVFGLDRLHKFYSELQARIGGNILRLQQNTEQKMVDLINQNESLVLLQTNLEKTARNNKELSEFLKKYMQDKPKGDVF
jgi:hypothetical protein